MEAGFVIVNVRLVVVFTAIRPIPNDLLITGGTRTVTLADAVPPAPPSVELTAFVVVVCSPAAEAVTFRLNEQLLLAAMLPPASVTLLDPAVAVMMPAPQDPAGPLATVSPDESVPAKATPLNATGLGFVMAKIKLVVPFIGTEAPPNVAVMVGGMAT